MEYSVREIEERVYALLDESREVSEELVDYGEMCASLSGLIDIFIEDAARIVVCTAEASRIDECEHYPRLSAQSGLHRLPAEGALSQLMGSTEQDPTTGKIRVLLPDNFLRLLYVRMSDWTDGVSTPLAFSGEECRLRMGARRGYRNHRHRPAVAIDRRGSVQYLEIFGSSTGASVAEFDYLTVPKIRDGRIELPGGLFNAVCEKTAEMVSLRLDRNQK